MRAATALVSIDVRKLKAVRASLGMDQATAAERLGVHRSVISHLETAIEPGGVLDRYIETLLDAACEQQMDAHAEALAEAAG